MTTYDRQSRITAEKDKYEEKPDYSRDDDPVDEPIVRKAYERPERRRFTFEEAQNMLGEKQGVGRTHERDH